MMTSGIEHDGQRLYTWGEFAYNDSVQGERKIMIPLLSILISSVYVVLPVPSRGMPQPIWSHDGKHLAFEANDLGSN